MRESRPKALLVIVGLGLLACGAVVALLVIVNAGDGFAGCTGMSRYGWITPLVAVSALSGLSWVLLRQESHRGGDDVASAQLRSCPTCGHDVLVRWRLCPYCGGMLDDRPERGTSGEDDT